MRLRVAEGEAGSWMALKGSRICASEIKHSILLRSSSSSLPACFQKLGFYDRSAVIDARAPTLIVKCSTDPFPFATWLYLSELDSSDLAGPASIGRGWNRMHEGEGIFGVCSILYCIPHFVSTTVCMLPFNALALLFLYLYLGEC